MYPAIQATADRIAQEAYQLWLTSSDYEALINKRLIESNMTDWKSTVMDALTQVIKSAHLNAKL
jgi:hypothetical protein